jgi:hypothetical protein
MTARAIKIIGAIIAVGSVVATVVIVVGYPGQYNGVAFDAWVAATPLTVAALGVLIYAVGEVVDALRSRSSDPS